MINAVSNIRHRSSRSRLAAMPLALALVSASCVQRRIAIPVASPPPGEVMSDDSMARAVKRELLADRSVPADAVEVTAQNGVVTLEGHVQSLLSKRQAARLAAAVRGVRSVVNLLVVERDLTQSDEQLEREAEEALTFEPSTDAYQVEVSVVEAQATVRGVVDSFAEAQLVETVVASVDGLTSVVNELRIVPRTARSDQALRDEIAARLRWDALVDASFTEVRVDDGRVTLRGSVGSLAEKQRAVADAWVLGVKDVRAEDLEIAAWARDPERAARLPRPSPQEIGGAVELALLYDPRVSATGVKVDVLGDSVVLHGEVSSLSAKRAAQQDAAATVGVGRVDNRIVVSSAIQGNESVAERIRRALARSPLVNREAIRVGVQDGVAHLTGAVATEVERDAAERIASRAVGVQRVDNDLLVTQADGRRLAYDPQSPAWYPYDAPITRGPAASGERPPDALLAERIEAEMFWSPYVDASRVYVRVQDGVATLLGTVQSRSEMIAAINNAYQGGATRVENRLIAEAPQFGSSDLE